MSDLAERVAAYKICQVRGHESSGITLAIKPSWSVCVYCGTHYRFSHPEVIETNIPAESMVKKPRTWRNQVALNRIADVDQGLLYGPGPRVDFYCDACNPRFETHDFKEFQRHLANHKKRVMVAEDLQAPWLNIHIPAYRPKVPPTDLMDGHDCPVCYQPWGTCAHTSKTHIAE